ncbi:MAG: (4Fe-4S)-binding protein, partial [Culicoidibacterales bacterium]
MNKPTISVTKNASYITTDIDTLHTDTIDLPLRKTAFLCRCGQSQKKPYCDSSHSRVHFDGSQQKPYSAKKRAYLGDGITIFYNPSPCGHIAACVSGLPEVFNSEKSPWIDPNASDTESIIATIKKCPSGALSYQLDGEVEVTDWFDASTISLIENGPY